MAKFIHLYETVEAFEADYNGDNYLEPWLSFTDQDGDVNYNKSCEVVSNVVTSLTATDDGLYDVDSMDYRLVEVFQAPRTAIEYDDDAVQLYAKYEPVSGTSAMGTQWLTGYLTVDPTGHTEGQGKFLILMEDRYSNYEPTLAPPNYGVSGFSFGDGYACPDPYDNKNWKIVATFNGTVPDTSEPREGNYGAEMTILENTMPEYPFLPEEVTLSGATYLDAELSFTVNGVTYTNATPDFYPFYITSYYSQKTFIAADYHKEDGGGEGGTFIGFRYVLSERKLYVYKW